VKLSKMTSRDNFVLSLDQNGVKFGVFEGLESKVENVRH
jgi:hypothetical protein